jgi:NTE family protein
MTRTKKIINLALQGGGAHGAFTWGVIDRLIEEEKLVIEGISGTSAGAINGAVLIDGYIKGGIGGAKRNLETFWRRVSDAAAWSPFHKNPVEDILGGWDMNAASGYRWFDAMSRTFSPYAFNPLNLNPMRDILEDMIDTRAIRKHKEMKLFVTATHVQSNQPHVFHCDEVSIDALLASSCIPLLFQGGEGGRRVLLGRRLYGQSRHLAAHIPLRITRRRAGADQPHPYEHFAANRHRNRRPAKRDYV